MGIGRWLDKGLHWGNEEWLSLANCSDFCHNFVLVTPRGYLPPNASLM